VVGICYFDTAASPFRKELCVGETESETDSAVLNEDGAVATEACGRGVTATAID